MLDRAQAPAFTRSTDLTLIRPLTATLGNGLRLYFISGGQQPVVKVEVVLQAGRWFENQSGVAYFVAGLLNKGTSSQSSFEIAQQFDSLGAHLEITPGLDTLSIALYGLTKNLPAALDQFVAILSDPVFPEEELRQQKSIYLQNLKINQEKTSYLASRNFRQHMFGSTHPYGAEPEETNIASLTREQIVKHFSDHGKDAIVIVSGLVTEESRSRIASTFEKLEVQRTQNPVFSTPEFKTGRTTTSKEGRLQSSLRMGKPSIHRKHSDYPALLFLNHVLGGYFGSRLMKNIREEKGLTYGIYSSLHNLQHASYLVIGADVNKENQDIAFDEIRKEIRRLSAEPIPFDELEVARNHFIGSVQSEITTPFAHADKLRTRILFDLPETYYTQLINTIDSVSPEELMRVANAILGEDSFAEIAVG